MYPWPEQHWKALVWFLVIIPSWVTAFFGAVYGRAWTDQIGGVVFLPVMSLAIAGFASWRSLRRPAADRRALNRALSTGVPTGRADLDEVVLAQLRRESRRVRSDRVGAAGLAVAFLAAPVVAAVRVSPWFLVLLVPVAVAEWVLVGRARLPDPRDRLARFDAATAARQR